MTDLSFLDTKVSEVIVPREAPPGNYMAQLMNMEKEENDGKVFYDLEFRLREALDGQDLTGVNLDRAVHSRLVVTAKNIGFVKGDLQKFGPDIASMIDPLSIREAIEQIVGAQPVVKAYVSHDKYWADRGREKAVISSGNWTAV